MGIKNLQFAASVWLYFRRDTKFAHIYYRTLIGYHICSLSNGIIAMTLSKV